jgi:hypothetical protein
MNKSNKFTLSKSALDQFMSGCPAKYTFYQKWNLAKMPPALDFGIRVHKMMQEGLPNPHTPAQDLEAVEIAERLLNLVEKAGYRILAQEVKHIAPRTDDIQMFALIDAIAELDGEPVLVDFKTGARLWKKWKTMHGEIVTPKAAGFQGTIYLTPPYPGSTSDHWGAGIWPNEMHFLMAPKEGPTHIYKYYTNEADKQNLIRAATMLKDAADRGWFPKNKGWLCESCDWMQVCWELPDWERHYVERKQHEADTL